MSTPGVKQRTGEQPDPDPVLLFLRQLREQVPQAVNSAVLTITARPDLLNRVGGGVCALDGLDPAGDA